MKGVEYLETFVEPKPFVRNPEYTEQRQTSLEALDIETIDRPIVDIVKNLQALCYGHFVHAAQRDRNNTERLPDSGDVGSVTYRIAYIALCVENSADGKDLYRQLAEIPAANPDYIQFGSAEWFWARHVNSYALQVEPRRYMNKDQITIGYPEALRIQEARDTLFSEIRKVIQVQSKGT
jgi:hypothetical protein